jgi:hypothetical protein
MIPYSSDSLYLPTAGGKPSQEFFFSFIFFSSDEPLNLVAGLYSFIGQVFFHKVQTVIKKHFGDNGCPFLARNLALRRGAVARLDWHASLGAETDGSILSLSSVNNLVGIKPLVGLTSRSLVIPISEHQDTVGKGIPQCFVWAYRPLCR